MHRRVFLPFHSGNIAKVLCIDVKRLGGFKSWSDPAIFFVPAAMWLYVTLLQCFDAVGWAAGRASGL